MTTEYMDFKGNITADQAFKKIRKEGANKETLSICYVTDAERRLEGIISIQNLILASPDAKISDIMESPMIAVNTHDDQEEVANLFTKYHAKTIPVTDKEDRLVGIITSDDILKVIQEEATEDIQLMNKMLPNEKPYLETTVIRHAGNRILWLMVLMIAAIFIGELLASFEDAFLVVPLLVSFIPMLMDTGGSSGSQTSTLIIRGLALGQLKFKGILKILFKELRVSLLVGGILAIFNVVRIVIQYQDFQLGIVVGLGLYITVLLANILGVLLPLLFKKLKMDPALMVSPIITTIVDLAAIYAYFTIARAILGI
jgi:magnesium transporter